MRNTTLDYLRLFRSPPWRPVANAADRFRRRSSFLISGWSYGLSCREGTALTDDAGSVSAWWSLLSGGDCPLRG